MEDKQGFLDYFKSIPDHRIDRKKLYSVEELLLVTFCGIIGGCEGWAELELFGKTKLTQLREYLPFENGAPSDDTLRRFFRALDPKHFEGCFIQWVKSWQQAMTESVIAIDGKTLRGTREARQRPLHVVNAYASEYGLVLGQRPVEGRSNEIKAIPELLTLLDQNTGVVKEKKEFPAELSMLVSENLAPQSIHFFQPNRSYDKKPSIEMPAIGGLSL